VLFFGTNFCFPKKSPADNDEYCKMDNNQSIDIIMTMALHLEPTVGYQETKNKLFAKIEKKK
jgi:hypothetical protein